MFNLLMGLEHSRKYDAWWEKHISPIWNQINNICQNLNGRFFISTDLLSVKAVMLIPKSHNFKDIATTLDFCELLSDRLSPVYIEFFGI